MEFAFENPARTDPVLFGEHPEDLYTERAATELAELLPENAIDADAVSAISARDRASLNAIKDLVKAVQETAGIHMRVHSASGERSSGLTLDQARIISDTLEEGEIQRERLEVEGRLDGVRTRRRVFYFEGAGSDYEGGFEQDLADTVKRFIDQPAIAVLERVRRRRRTGIASRWSYRLLHLRAPGDTLPEIEELPVDET